jgi:hypothetical protein
MSGDEEILRFRPEGCVLLLAVIFDTGTNSTTLVLALPQLITEYSLPVRKGAVEGVSFKIRM